MSTSDAFETLAIHAGNEPDPLTGAVVPAVQHASTYKQDGVGGLRSGYEYARSGNPTRRALEECLAAIESVDLGSDAASGVRGLAFSSGLAAQDAVFRGLCKPGDHVVIPDDAYGGTFRLVSKVHQPWGLDYTPVPVSDPQAVAAAIVPGKTKIVWVETPTNPLLNIGDIEALADVAHKAGALLIVDNTFASPYLQRPFNQGADVVMYSTTKYLGGHSDVVGGALVVRDAAVGDVMTYHQNAMGGVPGPDDCYLVLRGIKTLAVRMDRHSDNARAIVELLQSSDIVTEIRYPGLETHPGHDVAKRQMSDFGGMVSFRVAGGEAAALKIVSATRLFTLAESLGGVESLIEHPGRMTHASAAGSPLEVPNDLVRLSVGIENANDQVADLRQALEAAR